MEPDVAHHRPTFMNATARALLVVLALIALAGCAAGSASPSGSPSPSLPAPASPTPGSPTPGTSPSPPPDGGDIATPDEAAARVVEEFPMFTGIGPMDPDLIGACCWYEASRVNGGFQVTFTVGWGDCPAGCIDRHNWTFAVTPAGQVGLIAEDGPSVPPGQLPG
jgi:hypothetical protein